MATAKSTFAERLNEAFEHRGITDTQEKINHLVAATGRKARTVARWLSGDTMPRGGFANQDVRVLIARDLRISAYWLICGEGYSPRQSDLYEKLEKLPREYIPKLTRYFLRLLNNDPKALRWAKMLDQGEIGMGQILAMA
ncbi:MAG: hypothetical protein B7Y26_13905 [Hydrogenophilales bacterium 16-64-46]|nr:MAG: hypothetical protein B7Z32_13545 [Hydrogenophilales bacterium 12-64-13]OYZ03954.1 MAG: hypothetical protein B7Y26_13905 [Hydrogenophilales bacterium 16-64-46]OZA36652.1 MAG: hypothetical protein B7X87_13600 [Hydrogenophilales bacterium 17-64-34]HQT01153.1 hypothetical protein [Thiobacillus sp.]